jgi:phospholipid/cholesterol/gamma-HCH transport system permease protein
VHSGSDGEYTGSVLKLCLRPLAKLGAYTWEQARDVRYIAAVLGTLLFLSAQPRRWRRTVRAVFARQVWLVGVESIRFTCVVAVLVGISLVVQLQVWSGRVGQSQLLGPVLVAVVARELGPLFANFVLIVRAGSALTTELGLMKAGGEIRVLEAQGVEPLIFVVMPRVVAMAVAAFSLTVLFVLVAFVSGYLFGQVLGEAKPPSVFLVGVFKAVQSIDAVGICLKSLGPALVTGVICATAGLSVGASVAEVPATAKRALVRSLGALFFASALISLLMYL